MNELMIALAELARAGKTYLEAKTAESKIRTISDQYWHDKELAKPTERPFNPAEEGSDPIKKTEPEKAPEATAGKKPRRTKEQIAADTAAAQAKVTADAQAKLAAEGAAGPAAINAALQQPAPAPQQPVAAAPATNPLGDLGAFGAQPPAPAPSLKEQIADAQAKTAALQTVGAIAAAPVVPTVPAPAAAPSAPKVMTEEESKVNLARSVAIFVKLTAGTGATEEKLDAARNVFRAYMMSTLKAAKVKDLTHDQRVLAAAWLDAEVAKLGAK